MPGGPPFAPLEEITATQGGYPKSRIQIQDLIRHTPSLSGAEVPHGRARGYMARQLSDAIPKLEEGKGKGTRGRGIDGLLSQRLLKRWTGERVSRGLHFTRSKRESKLAVSLIRTHGSM